MGVKAELFYPFCDLKLAAKQNGMRNIEIIQIVSLL